MKLIVKQLHVEDLVDTGSKSDPQDPALKITLGKTSHTTAR
jgi:hypothetical protein